METFCQICRHPSPGHELNCPVKTGEPQKGYQYPFDIQQVAQQQVEGQMGGWSAHWSTYEGTQKLLAELKMQVEVNKRLAKDLIHCRLELEKMKGTRGK